MALPIGNGLVNLHQNISSNEIGSPHFQSVPTSAINSPAASPSRDSSASLLNHTILQSDVFNDGSISSPENEGNRLKHKQKNNLVSNRK